MPFLNTAEREEMYINTDFVQAFSIRDKTVNAEMIGGCRVELYEGDDREDADHWLESLMYELGTIHVSTVIRVTPDKFCRRNGSPINQSIEDMDLSARAFSVLRKTDLWHSDDIYEYLLNYKSMSGIPYVGLKTEEEILSKMNEMGYDLSFMSNRWR